jgi:hypothetical protein
LVDFGFKADGNTPLIAFQNGFGVEAQSPFFKQDSFVVEDIHQTVFETRSNGFWCALFFLVIAHDIMGILGGINSLTGG